MLNKRCNFFVIIFIILLVSFVSAQYIFEQADEDIDEYTEETLHEQAVNPDTGLPERELPEDYNIEDTTITTYNTDLEPTQEVQFQGTTSEDLTWQTTKGTITNYEMQNAIFSLGALTQASLLSFENNNYLFFSSLFDDSNFQLILNEGESGQITQKNSMEELGRVYVSMDGGNLTKDEAMLFVPEGDNPTYIYYNTTEVEFEDGTIYYQDESVTNKDETKETSTITFDENGFTSVEIQPENNYTFGVFKFINNERDSILACKNNNNCKININEEEQSYEIKGKVDFYFNDELFVSSLDSNNHVIFDRNLQRLELINNDPRDELLVFYNGHFKVVEGEKVTYSLVREEFPKLIENYNTQVQSKMVEFVDGALIYQNQIAFTPGSLAEQKCLDVKETKGYCERSDIVLDNEITAGAIFAPRLFSRS
ncbi:hypothetical protein CL616_03655 [archaeon]|nr:hypothetical protein [archaeon]